MMCRACGNIGTTFEALKQHSTATTYHEQVKTSFIPRKPFFLEMKIIFFFLAAERRHSHQWQACKDFWIQQSGWECFRRWFRIWWFYNFMFCQSIDGALGCEIMDRRRRCIALPQERGAAKFFWANYFVHPSPSAPWTLHLFLFTNSDQLLRPDRVPAWKTPCRGWTPPGSASCFQSLYH